MRSWSVNRVPNQGVYVMYGVANRSESRPNPRFTERSTRSAPPPSRRSEWMRRGYITGFVLE